MHLRSFGWLAATVFTAPILMLGSSIVKLGMDFEFTMSKMTGLANVAKESIGKVTEELLKMAKVTATDPQKLADTMYFVASSGIQGAEALRVTELAAKGAASGMGDAVDVANLLTSAMNAYRATGLTAMHMMDVLTATIREGKGEPAEMVRSFGSVMLMAAEAGIKVEDLAGSFALLTLTTNSAANSATYLRQLLMTLLKPTPGEEDIMSRMKTSSQELQKIFREGGIMAGLMRMRELTKQYGESMAELFPNLRAFLAMTGLTGQNLEYNQSVMKKFNNIAGDFNSHVLEMSKTMRWQWNAALADAKSSLTVLGYEITQSILPIFKNLVERLTNLVKWFTNLSDAQKEAKLRTLTLLAVIGPASLILATVGNALGTIWSWVSKLSTSLGGLTKILKVSPYFILAGILFGVVRAMKEHRDEVDRAEIANSKLNSTLIEVEGTLKRLSQLTDVDYSAMTYMALVEARNAAQAARTEAWNKKQVVVQTGQLTQEQLSEGRWGVNPVTRHYLEKWSKAGQEATDTYNELTKAIIEYWKALKPPPYLAPFEPIPGKRSKITSQEAYEMAEGNRTAISAFNAYRNAINATTGVQKGFGMGLPFETPGTGGWQLALETANKEKEIAREIAKKEMLLALETANKEMQRMKTIASELTYIFEGLFMTIGEGWKAMTEQIILSLRRLIAEVMAKLIVYLILSTISGGTSNLAIAAKELMGGNFWKFMLKPSGRRMAGGGTVPPGYPNDSYPARLSSGETIVPPCKHDNLIKSTNIHITIDGKIAGKDLALALRRANIYN